MSCGMAGLKSCATDASGPMSALEIQLCAELEETSELNGRWILPVRTVRVVIGRRGRGIEHVRDVQVARHARAAESQPLRQSHVELPLTRAIHRPRLNERNVHRGRRAG